MKHSVFPQRYTASDFIINARSAFVRAGLRHLRLGKRRSGQRQQPSA
jgi:hypothetical protein